MARAALDETIEFSKAIEVALNLTSEQDTLIVVTADHGHAFRFDFCNFGVKLEIFI